MTVMGCQVADEGGGLVGLASVQRSTDSSV